MGVAFERNFLVNKLRGTMSYKSVNELFFIFIFNFYDDYFFFCIFDVTIFVCHQSGILNRKMSLAQLYEVTVGPLVLKYFITKWWQILLRILERILHFNYLLMKSLHFFTFVVYWTKKLPRQVMREAASAH